MKKIVVFIIMVSLYGCSSYFEVQKSVYFSAYDFSSYTARGFLFTPEQYLEPYESVGLVEVILTPNVRKTIRVSLPDTSEYELVEGLHTTYWLVEKITPGMVIEEMYKRAKNMGADAVVRFKIDSEMEYNGAIYFPVYSVSGFAIKRKP